MRLDRFVLALGCCFGSASLVQAAEPARTNTKLKFNRDIRPILSNNCFVCHGPDNNLRKANLRLDREEDVFAGREGRRVIVSGKPDASELYRRVSAKEASKRMPPRKSGKQLTQAEKDILRRWIEQGGTYEKHWSLITPQRPRLPEVADSKWPRNPVDRFVLARMTRAGLVPSHEAHRRILIRRLSFDLTGLPPMPAEVDAFIGDTDTRAYEKLVERLLRSPHFGERMAMFWLDQVRYADTGGYHSDNHRDVYLYRDYVIDAFNSNMPFDRFTIEQIAGDLMPHATRVQKIASGYNRLLQTTEEGGAQPKEYTAKYAADRVRNFSTVWLGMTFGCAECHDHKFDPFTSKEFYRLEAFFADVQERAVGRQDQTMMPLSSEKAELDRLDLAMAPLQKLLETPTAHLNAQQVKWEKETQARKSPDGRTGSKLPNEISDILKLATEKRNVQQKAKLAAYYRSNVAPSLQGPREKLAALMKQRSDLVARIPTTLVAMSAPPRTVRVLRRGNWLDDSGEVVAPGLPASLPVFHADRRSPSRLDLARWLVAPENPLTARVFVNRLWALFFGQGLVKTPDDLGSQGAWPSHPELLDWLAVEFRESGWNVKHMVKLMVLSSTYRQASHAREELRQQDPYNQFLARQSAFRLDAEVVRDNALAVSGLLSREIGGPSVKPYQPIGYWQHLNFPKREYVPDKGDNQYRRGLYTYWQRSFLHPSLLAFDAPSREECTVQRPKSNTPLQALVLLNDPSYVEAARVLAESTFRAGNDAERRIRFAFRRVLGRSPQAEEIGVLSQLHDKHLADFRQDDKAAAAILHVGDRPPCSDIPGPELAAWTSVARVILNLHETVTRE